MHSASLATRALASLLSVRNIALSINASTKAVLSIQSILFECLYSSAGFPGIPLGEQPFAGALKPSFFSQPLGSPGYGNERSLRMGERAGRKFILCPGQVHFLPVYV